MAALVVFICAFAARKPPFCAAQEVGAASGFDVLRGTAQLRNRPLPVIPSHEEYQGLSPREIGEIVFDVHWCLRCHNLHLKGGVRAPSLDNLAVRRSPDWIREKLLAPQEKLPGSFMPAYGHLSEREIQGLVAFLGSLTPERKSPDNIGQARIEAPLKDDGSPRFAPARIDRGKALFTAQGCVGCHTINGFFQGGQMGPNLTHEALRKRDDAWQLQHLIDPVSVYMGGERPEVVSWIMPSFGQLPEDDLEALVALLQSLH